MDAKHHADHVTIKIPSVLNLVSEPGTATSQSRVAAMRATDRSRHYRFRHELGAGDRRSWPLRTA